MPTLTIPDAVYARLAARAADEHTTVEALAARLLAADPLDPPDLPFDDELLDTEYHAACEADTSPVPTLEEVRAITAKIPGGLTADIIADREDRW
jgi:hypothetical protein